MCLSAFHRGISDPPRKDGSKYGVKAAEHDRLVKIVLGIMDEVKWGALEHPSGELEKQLYMLQWDAKRQKVNLCAYKWPHRKATTVWTQGFEWQPKGETGDGPYGGKCGQGTVSKVTGRFVHHQAHSVHPEKGARGAGHIKVLG